MTNTLLNGTYIHDGETYQGADLLRHETNTNLVIRKEGSLSRIWNIYDETAGESMATSMVEITLVFNINNEYSDDFDDPYTIKYWSEK